MPFVNNLAIVSVCTLHNDFYRTLETMMISQIKRPQRELCVRARACGCVRVAVSKESLFINLLFLFLLALLHKTLDYKISGNNINHQ